MRGLHCGLLPAGPKGWRECWPCVWAPAPAPAPLGPTQLRWRLFPRQQLESVRQQQRWWWWWWLELAGLIISRGGCGERSPQGVSERGLCVCGGVSVILQAQSDPGVEPAGASACSTVLPLCCAAPLNILDTEQVSLSLPPSEEEEACVCV